MKAPLQISTTTETWSKRRRLTASKDGSKAEQLQERSSSVHLLFFSVRLSGCVSTHPHTFILQPAGQRVCDVLSNLWASSPGSPLFSIRPESKDLRAVKHRWQTPELSPRPSPLRPTPTSPPNKTPVIKTTCRCCDSTWCKYSLQERAGVMISWTFSVWVDLRLNRNKSYFPKWKYQKDPFYQTPWCWCGAVGRSSRTSRTMGDSSDDSGDVNNLFGATDVLITFNVNHHIGQCWNQSPETVYRSSVGCQ